VQQTRYVIDLAPATPGDSNRDMIAVVSVGRGDGAAPDVVTARLVIDLGTFGTSPPATAAQAAT
jgi:hypothetical protein